MKVIQFDDLTFSNDFAFCNVLSKNEDLCIKITELITGHKIRRIVKKESQKTIKESLNGKGVRFDIYFEDDDSIYDIEIQTSDLHNLPKRTRYYHSMSDLDSLRTGTDYRDLKNSYVIFICTFDPFGKGLYKYTVQRTIKEDSSICFDDGAASIFISSESILDDIPKDMKAFLLYLRTGTVSDDLTGEIDSALRNLLNNDERRTEYMTLLERDELMRAEGQELKAKEIAQKLLKEQMSPAQISEITGLPAEAIAELEPVYSELE